MVGKRKLYELVCDALSPRQAVQLVSGRSGYSALQRSCTMHKRQPAGLTGHHATRHRIQFCHLILNTGPETVRPRKPVSSAS